VSTQDVVVVGVDGSPESDAAVAWAAKEAVQLDAVLRIVHVWHAPSYPTDPVLSLPAERSVLVTDAAALAAATNPQVRCETVTRSGLPSITFIELSAGASLIVLGGHHRNVLDRMVFGSVTTHILSQASCPVVVVRTGTVRQSLSAPGPVVVGVDHEGTSDDAVEFAFDYADAHGVDLVAVQAWTAHELATGDDGDPRMIRSVQDPLAESLRLLHEKYPQVRVITAAACETPVNALLDWADRASMLVVGSRGRGYFTGMLLGSVSAAVAHQAACSVTVVRPRTVSQLLDALDER